MPLEGNSGQRKGVRSERRPVMGRIALLDLGYSERKQTYTVVSICDESGNPMNKGEGGLKSEYTDEDCEPGRNERSRFAPGSN
jgi:hypothetical protein